MLINILRLIENLEFKLSRFSTGFFIISVIILFYFLKIDKIFFCIIAFLVIVDLIKSNLLNKKIIFYSITMIITVIFFFQNHNLSILPVNYLLIPLIFFIFIFDKFFKYIFITILIYLLLIFYELILFDRNLVFLLIFISFFNDTIAFIAGKNLKGKLIIPSISPNKTWSGTGISFVMTASLFLFLNYSLYLSIVLSISLFFGDIFFSYIKRMLNLKDFSNSLPSHGGILDRFDSTFFLMFSISFSIL